MNKFLLLLLVIALCSFTVTAVNVFSLDKTSRFQKDLQLLRSKDLLGNTRLLGNAAAYLTNKDEGYFGIRSVFQWNLARVTHNNDGIFNYLHFYATSGGYIGLQNSNGGRNYNIILSIWDGISAEPGPGFKCQSFGDGYQCFQENFIIEDHKLYYLDVEIEDNIFKGYISEPQISLDTFNTTVKRAKIGSIIMPNVQENLHPYGYYVENYSGNERNCSHAQDLTVVNFVPRQYKIYGQLNDAVQSTFKTTELYRSDCVEINQLVALTDKKDAFVYLTRPTIY